MKKIFVAALFFFNLVAFCQAANIIRVETASRDVLVVVVETIETEADPTQDVNGWTINNQVVQAVGRWTYVWESKPVDGNTIDLIKRHHLYLSMNENLQSGQNYDIGTPYGNTSFTFDEDELRCESIKVNQSAYFGLSSKRYANFGIYLGCMPHFNCI